MYFSPRFFSFQNGIYNSKILSIFQVLSSLNNNYENQFSKFLSPFQNYILKFMSMIGVCY